MSDIGNKIRTLRRAKDMTQEELADKLHVARATINKYENGVIQNLPRTKIEMLAEALDTTPGYLLGWSPVDDDHIMKQVVETWKTPDVLKEDNKEESGPLIGETWVIAEPVIANAKKRPNLGMRMGKPKTTLLTEEEKELVKIYKELPVRKRTELLNYAYKLQDENGGPHEAKWVNISEMIDAPTIKKETKK